MTRTFTSESLIAHLYREIAPAQRSELDRALQEDYFLREEYEALRQAYLELPKVKFYPSTASIRRILDHSSSRR